MKNPNGYSVEEIEMMKEDQLDEAFRDSAAQFHDPKFAEHIIRKWYWLGQRSILDMQKQPDFDARQTNLVAKAALAERMADEINQYRNELENPAPDVSMRLHLRQKLFVLAEQFDALINQTDKEGNK